MKNVLKLFGVTLVIIALIFMVIVITMSSGNAEYETFTCWVICQPNDYVNARAKPMRRSTIAGRFDPIDEITTDGVIKNGYLHIVGMGLETGDAWIHAGYISYEKPEKLGGQPAIVVSRGKLAARKYINGKVRKWLKRGSQVTVYYVTDEWAVTNRGFVKTQYIDLE